MEMLGLDIGQMDHGRGHQEHQERRKILRGGKRVSLPEEQALHQGCRLQDQQAEAVITKQSIKEGDEKKKKKVRFKNMVHFE